MKVSQEEYSLLEEIAAEYNTEPIQPNEITSIMLAEKANISRQSAREKLDKECRKGNLTKRTAFVNGKWMSVYKKVEKGE